jgi:hypothetical protein
VSGQVILASIACYGNPVVSPTCTGTNGLNVTWTLVSNQVDSAVASELTVFRGIPTSGAGTLTFDYGATSQSAFVWNIMTFTNVNQTTAQGVVQSAKATGTSATPAVTLSTFGNGSNAAVMVSEFQHTTVQVWTPKTGYTGYSSFGSAYRFFGAEWLGSSDATPNGTITSTIWCAVGVELAAVVVVAPTVTTQAVSSIATTTATGNGNITATGGANADTRGIVYSTATQTLPGNVAPGSSGYSGLVNETGGSFSTGAYTESLTGLTGNTTYYARAYAHNSAGYSYGAEVSFSTTKIAVAQGYVIG